MPVRGLTWIRVRRIESVLMLERWNECVRYGIESWSIDGVFFFSKRQFK